ncbi:MAG: hypothetical protein RBR97_20715 [Bacteroidales bacterium]|jgi:hypothetical protein|nr:hypothetical protein [Bacteroidales bacterium]
MIDTENISPFSNLFDIEKQDIDSLIIKETYNQGNCFIYNGTNIIGGFIIDSDLKVLGVGVIG